MKKKTLWLLIMFILIMQFYSNFFIYPYLYRYLDFIMLPDTKYFPSMGTTLSWWKGSVPRDFYPSKTLVLLG